MNANLLNRREFLTGAAAAGALLALGCSEQPIREESTLAQSPLDDFRLNLLRYAILAPNSHNTQPWRVELRGSNALRLFVDRSRLLPFTDPPARQIHISQGTFLELLDLAARQHGYRAEIEYFPEGEYGNAATEPLPVAQVAFQPDRLVRPDPLFAQIPLRLSNKRPYRTGRSIPTADWQSLRAATRSEAVGLRTVECTATRKELAEICREAMRIEVASTERNRETAGWFRFSDRELEVRRDGFGLAQNGIEEPRKWIAERFLLSRSRASSPQGAFAQGAISQTEEQAGTASGFAALIGRGNTRRDQVLAGRAYARANLAATQLGLAMQPLSQSLEEYAEMAALQRKMKFVLQVPEDWTVQMLFRLGYARPTPFSPRRDVSALLAPPVKS